MTLRLDASFVGNARARDEAGPQGWTRLVSTASDGWMMEEALTNQTEHQQCEVSLSQLRDEIIRRDREIERRDAELARLGRLLIQAENEAREQLTRVQANSTLRLSQLTQIIAALLNARRGGWPFQTMWLRREMKAVQNTGLFDADWYRHVNADVRKEGLDPLWHFVVHGMGEGRSPNPGPRVDAHPRPKVVPHG